MNITRTLLLLVCLLLLALAVTDVVTFVPNQQPVALAAGIAKPAELKGEKLPDIFLYVPLHPRHFRGELPPTCTVEVTLPAPACQAWRLTGEAEVYEYTATGSELPDPFQASVRLGGDEGDANSVYVSGLAPGGLYRLKITLEYLNEDLDAALAEAVRSGSEAEKKKVLERLEAKAGEVPRSVILSASSF